MAESTSPSQCSEMSGWLFKWTNYLRGYQKRWFVLSNGYFSYYRNQEEMDHSHRGSIYMHGAIVFSEQPNTFVVSNGDTYRIKTATEFEKRKWMEALDMAKRSTQTGNVGITSMPALSDSLKGKLEDLRKCQELLRSHGHALQSSLSVIEVSSSCEAIIPKIQEINERAAVFRSSASALIKACSDYLDLAECQSDKWLKIQQTGKRVWPENVVAFMKRLSFNKHGECKGMSSSYNEHSTGSSFSTDPRPSDSDSTKTTVLVYPAFAGSSKESKTTGGGVTNPLQNENKQSADTVISKRDEGGGKTRNEGKRKQGNAINASSEQGNSLVSITSACHRRIQLPIARSTNAVSLWSIIKNHVGKDLYKMPVPINFCEPLSFLQRLTEDFEYAHILDKASALEDPAEQIAYVAGFAVSSYSSTPCRTAKPFNPLLGETYECDRTRDLGWKSIAEQVSHHPPISAIHCEGKQWACWLDLSVTSKFQGQLLSFMPSGDIHLKFNSGNHYIWNKVASNIHNIIIGKLWVNQEGDMIIKCLTNGFTCKVSFLSPGYFGEAHKVKGVVTDKDGLAKLHITGGYDSRIEIDRINNPRNQNATNSLRRNEVIWQKRALPEDSEMFYNFTVFASQLNEMEEGVAPTDSRNRPDQRLMENGKWEDASKKKVELEEKQRNAKKKRDEAFGTEKAYAPAWFQIEKDSDTNKEIYVYKGNYWPCKLSKNWSRCPVIFL